MKNKFLILVCVMVLGACETGPDTGSHIGNPATVEFRVVSSELQGAPGDESQNFADDAGTVFTLTNAQVVVRDIKLDLPVGIVCADVNGILEGAFCEPAQGPGEEDTVVIEGPFVMDLLTRTSVPSLENVVIPAVNYRRVDFRLKEETQPWSFSVDATFMHEAQPANLQLRLAINEDARVENPTIQLDANGTLVVAFDTASWLNGAPIAACLANGDLVVTGGVMVVDENSACDGIHDAIKDNVKSSTRLLAE